MKKLLLAITLFTGINFTTNSNAQTTSTTPITTDFNNITTTYGFSAYGGQITQKVWFETASNSLSGLGLNLIFTNASVSTGKTAFKFSYNGAFTATSLIAPTISSPEPAVTIGSTTDLKRLRIYGPNSTGASGTSDAVLSLWQSAGVIMHLDGNDVWSEDNLSLNNFSDKNIYLCPKANGTGKIGIGTNAVPDGYRMAVNGGMTVNNVISIDAKLTGAWGYGLQIASNNNDTKAIGISNATSNKEVFLAYGDGSIVIDGPSFKVDRSGNVSIGSVNPFPAAYKLAVNGSMICTKVVVKPRNMWPDYMFAKNHKVASIAEVEQYIHKHGHLQDMPTAAQVAEQGVDVGEMNRLLLQKVEELTLQLIELNKTVQQLKKDVRK